MLCVLSDLAAEIIATVIYEQKKWWECRNAHMTLKWMITFSAIADRRLLSFNTDFKIIQRGYITKNIQGESKKTWYFESLCMNLIKIIPGWVVGDVTCHAVLEDLLKQYSVKNIKINDLKHHDFINLEYLFAIRDFKY